MSNISRIYTRRDPYHLSCFALSQARSSLDRHQGVPDPIFIIDNLWEPGLARWLRDIELTARFIKRHRPDARVYVMANTNDRECDVGDLMTWVDDFLLVDFFAYRVWQQIFVKAQCAFIQAPVPDSDATKRFLFLTGKLHKKNRALLLKKYADLKLLDRAEWSMFYFESNIERNQTTRKILSQLSDQQFREFIEKYRRNPDVPGIANFGAQGFEYNGIPYDLSLYRDTAFSVVPETSFDADENAWITEKTWLPMINHHPFLLAGDNGILRKLEKMGFLTYREFLKVPDYDAITDPDARLDAIVINTVHWLDNRFDQEKISGYTSHNFHQLSRLHLANQEKILKFMFRNDLDQRFSIDDLVPTVGRNDDIINRSNRIQQFVKFYNSVKDPHWPSCDHPDDFSKLPEHIQKECIEMFGYQP